MSRVGVVVIGRNEGERLKTCLQSLLKQSSFLVYVDSGSSDDSVQYAKQLDINVVELDMSIPFSAARARNAGLERLRSISGDLSYVQFVDGDVILDRNWIENSSKYLDLNEKVAVVCGRLREEYRQDSVYNRLLDLEWNVPVGEAKSCGGIAMMRLDAISLAGGFDAGIIAAEEDELCLRLRRAGYQVHRLSDEMGLHDGKMHRFAQWWTRTKRSGYAYAQGCYLHGGSPERHFLRETISALVWGFLIPITIAALSMILSPWCLLLILLYPLLAIRIYRGKRRRGTSRLDAYLYAVFITIAKFPQFTGVVQFALRTMSGDGHKIIEYKRPTNPRSC